MKKHQYWRCPRCGARHWLEPWGMQLLWECGCGYKYKFTPEGLYNLIHGS